MKATDITTVTVDENLSTKSNEEQNSKSSLDTSTVLSITEKDLNNVDDEMQNEGSGNFFDIAMLSTEVVPTTLLPTTNPALILPDSGLNQSNERDSFRDDDAVSQATKIPDSLYSSSPVSTDSPRDRLPTKGPTEETE